MSNSKVKKREKQNKKREGQELLAYNGMQLQHVKKNQNTHQLDQYVHCIYIKADVHSV